MVIIQAEMGDRRARCSGGRTSMSIVLDNGDIHHFFALNDGVHHSTTRRFRGSYPAAVRRELARPGAAVVSEESSLLSFERPEPLVSLVSYDPGSIAS